MRGNHWISLGALLAGVAVAAGAMGTHLLKENWELPAEQLETFETAVRYQALHALALISVGLVGAAGMSRALTISAWLFLAGIVLFSGGLYGWIFTGIKPFVHVVPIGGTLWIVGWLFFAFGALARAKTPGPWST